MTTAYPLQWPVGRPRTKNRKEATFGKRVSGVGNSTDLKKLSIADALSRLQDEIDRLGATNYVLSSNLVVRLDGRPRGDQGNPADPGVCLYFTIEGKQHALPCDTYFKASDNIAAIAKHIEATRAIERYGVATVEEMFRGFSQLPPPGSPKRTWREIFDWPAGLEVDKPRIEVVYRALAKERHPDKAGGSAEAMAELNAAREAALKELA